MRTASLAVAVVLASATLHAQAPTPTEHDPPLERRRTGARDSAAGVDINPAPA